MLALPPVGAYQQLADCQNPTLLRQQRDISFQRPRILAEIFLRAKLRRIDEQRHDERIGALAAELQERHMAIVEVAHGRHHRHALAAKTGAVGPGLHPLG